MTLLARAPLTAAQQYLEKPREALESHGPRVWRPAVDPRLGPQTQALHQRLCGAMRTSIDLCERLAASAPAGWTRGERDALLPVLTRTQGTTALVLASLNETVDATGATRRTEDDVE